MKKLISMVVCTLMLWSCTIPAFAAERNIDNDNIHSPAFCTDVISEIADSTVMAVYHQQVMRFIIISDKPYQNIRQKPIIPFTLIQTNTFTTKCVSQSSIFIQTKSGLPSGKPLSLFQLFRTRQLKSAHTLNGPNIFHCVYHAVNGCNADFWIYL